MLAKNLSKNIVTWAKVFLFLWQNQIVNLTLFNNKISQRARLQNWKKSRYSQKSSEQWRKSSVCMLFFRKNGSEKCRSATEL